MASLRPTRLAAVVVATVVALLVVAPIASAQDAARTVTVRGFGTAEAPADVLEITFTVQEAADELDKSREGFERRCQGLRKAIEETTGVDDDGDDETENARPNGLELKVRWGPVEVVNAAAAATNPQQAQLQMMRRLQQGGAAAPEATQFTIRRRLTLWVGGVDHQEEKARGELFGLIDSLIERGADDGSGGSAPTFHYYRSDRERLEDAAYEKAVADATRRASKLADLTRTRLAGVSRIRELYPEATAGEESSDPTDADAMNAWVLALAAGQEPGKPIPEGPVGTIRIARVVEIEFELR